MNNGNTDSGQLELGGRSSQLVRPKGVDELSATKRELLQAEVRLAKARAAAAAAEADIKVISSRLRALTK